MGLLAIARDTDRLLSCGCNAFKIATMERHERLVPQREMFCEHEWTRQRVILHLCSKVEEDALLEIQNAMHHISVDSLRLTWSEATTRDKEMTATVYLLSELNASTAIRLLIALNSHATRCRTSRTIARQAPPKL